MKPCDVPLKVLFILPTLGAGGAERILVTLLNNLDRKAFDPEFLALSDEGPIKEWISEDIPFYSFGNRSVKSSVFKLIAFIRTHKPDVIFTTMVHSNALVLLMKIFFPKTRVIVREAALPSVLVSKYGVKGRACILVYKLLYRFADVVISNCSQMVDDFQNRIKIKTDNHIVLFNPVDISRVYETIPGKLELCEDRENTLCFVSVGRLSYEKGYDRLIERLATFQSITNWRLDLIGEGAYRDELKTLIAEKELEEHVFLRGYHSNPWEVAASADCLLLPSRWEGMPNVVLEGFSCGVPAIAMREAGGIIDIAKHAPDKHLKIVDTIEEFVSEMEKVNIEPKDKRAPSFLPEAFQLSTIMREFEGMLRG